MNNTSFTVEELRTTWHALSDLDRADRVENIHENGFSLREIASYLNCSASLLSHLLQAAQAPFEDRALARQGLLSTRDLVRRARSTGIRRANRHREEIAFEKERRNI